MSSSDTYLVYWQKLKVQQQLQDRQLAQQARQKLQAVVELLVNEFKVKKIILFGSLVRGNFDRESDIDLAVEGIPPSHYFQALAKINSMSDRWIDLKPLEALEPHFLQRVLQTGECLYASDISH